MTIIQSIILGIIQGITEFLPISSSGHLVIVPYLLGWQIPQEQIFPFDVLVQIGTLIAVIIYYWKDLIEIGRAMLTGILEKNPFNSTPAKTGWLTILATIPAGLIGLLFKDSIEGTFSNPQIAAGLLIITALMLYFSEKISKQSRDISKLNWVDALVMGVAQALAVFPGISRSGSTISGGLARNLKRKTAGQFAFLMSIPIMGAAGLLSIIDLFSIPSLMEFLPAMVIGFLTSGIVGYFSIKWLLGYISRNNLTPFAYYCLFIGAGTLMLSLINPVSSPVIEADTSEATIRVNYQSAAEWMLSEMHVCSEDFPQYNFLFQKSEELQVVENTTLHITYDETFTISDYAYKIGTDSFIFAANDQHPVDQLTQDALLKIISGEIDSIGDLDAQCEACQFDQQVSDFAFHIWSYPGLSNLMRVIEEHFAVRFSPSSTIAPTPALLKQALLADNTSLGFLPERMVDANLKNIEIIDGVESQVNVPVIVVSSGAPDDELEKWIICLQNAIQ